MRKYARQRAKAGRWRERDTAACAELSQPSVDKQGLRQYIYGKPGGESCFRFRFFRARGKKPLPLLIYLHGAGSFGYNGIMSMIEFAPVWLRKVREKCHALVPQLPLRGDSYHDDAWSENLTKIIDWIDEQTGNLDRSRIYIIGTSYGGYGAVMECLRYPERYAACVAAVAALGNLGRPLNDEDFEALEQTPLWLGYCRDEKNVNEPLYEALKKSGANVKQTYVKRFRHGAAGPVFWLTQPWAKWLFSYKNN